MRSKLIVASIALIVNAFFIHAYFSNLVTTGNRSANGFGALFLILFLGLFDLSLLIFYFMKKLSLIRTGLFICLLPIAIALISTVLGGGRFQLLLVITLPVGLLLTLIGLIMRAIK